MNKATVLLLESIHPAAFEELKRHFHCIEAPDPKNGHSIASQQDIDLIITRGKGKVDAALLELCPNLKIVARCGVGLDNIDIETATKSGIKVLNVPGVNAQTVAEHSLALMLMLIRKLYLSVSLVKSGNWAKRNGLNSDELNGKTLGILGLGNIGMRVAALAKAFNMQVSYWDPFVSNNKYAQKDFQEILSTADILTIHLPLTDDTHHLINATAIDHMKPHTILINTARGSIIDQQALYKALSLGKIAGFGADVLEKEPPDQNDPILQLPQVLISPHSASLTATTYQAMCQISVENIINDLYHDRLDPQYWFNK